ncbi:MAG: HutD family protein [Solimonas sp.]
MQILRSAAYRRMPWKNGGGETFEIAVSPSHATFENLDWRVSVARVTQDGPFSLLPDIDRTLCVLDGPGLALDFGADTGTRRVTPAAAPLPFAADQPLHARILGGAITDLNVMTRRSRYRHTVRSLPLDTAQTFGCAADHLFVFCVRGNVAVTIGAHAAVLLDARDSARVDDAQDAGPICVAAARPQDSAVYLIEIFHIAARIP